MQLDHRRFSLTKKASIALIGLALALALLAAAPTAASAASAAEINLLPTTDALNRTETTFSNGGKWSALAWDNSPAGHNTGRDTTSGWGPNDAWSTVNGAYWNQATFGNNAGSAAAATMQVAPGSAERYLSLWVDMSNPGTAKSGYQLRWISNASGGTYTVKLSKWSGGTETVLASNAAVTIATGTTMAITSSGGTITAWQGSGGSLSSILSAADASFSSGFAGIDGSGNGGRLTEFKAGNLLGEAVTSSTVLDSLERSEVPLNTGKWTMTSWANQIGGTWMGSYRGYGSGGSVAGAYWNQSTFGDSEGGDLVAALVGTGSTPANQYSALLLDLQTPGSAHSGYEARFTGTNGTATAYKVELAKWVSGTRTVLATTSGFSLPVNTTVALTGSGGAITLWTGTSTLSPLLSAGDSTYSGGYAGLEVYGGAGTVYNFRAAKLEQPLETLIQEGPSGTITVESASFGFGSPKPGATFECWLDAGSFGACSSPKAYSSLATGAHAFRVRAVSGANKDESPAERSFTVAPAPAVTTGAAVTAKGEATLKGSVNPNGAATTYQFEYGPTTSYGTKVPVSAKAVGSGSSPVEVSELITGLTSGTTYHYRLSATSASGTTKGSDQSFVAPTAPTATTEAGESSATEATLKASVTPNGAATTYQFEYGPTTSYGTKVPVSAKAVGGGTAPVAVSEAVTGLPEGSTYHYRVVAVNGVGTTYGEDKTIAIPFLPDATTEAAAPVGPNEAVLQGTVDPNGTATEYRFEYGTSTSYGSVIAPNEAGDGSQPIEASEAVAYLKPETTYHYRLIAASPAGIDLGQDKTLQTGPAVRTPAEEAAQLQAESSNAPDPGLPGDFFGMMWTGDYGQTGAPNVLSAIKNSGARILRLLLIPENEAAQEEVIRHASQRGITILPGIGGAQWPLASDTAARKKWRDYARFAVEKYGPGGSFWNGGGHPMRAWEIWNEPNLGNNSPITADKSNPVEKIAAEQFGDFFHEVAVELKAGAKGPIEVLAPGLFSFASSECKAVEPTNPNTKHECHLNPAQFLGQMGHESDYDAVSLHPYVFKVGANGHTPNGHDDAILVKNKVRSYIEDVRTKLKQLKEGGKPIWVTELGFPVENRVPEGQPGNPKVFPPVSPQTQREEIETSFGMMKSARNELGIAHAFYYNIQDYRNPAGTELLTWDYHSGLRAGKGGNRLGFRGYATVAPKGHPNWSSAKKPKNTGTSKRVATQATTTFDVETQGAQYLARAEWGGGPLSSSYPNATNWQVVEAGPNVEGEGEEEPVEVEANTVIGNLQPEATYHYRIAVKDENGNVEEEATGHQFTTKPVVEANIRSLNGEPGWINVSGVVNSATPINGAYVNVNFKKKEGGEYVFNPSESTHAALVNGSYSLENWQIGKGDWQVNVVFPGQGETPQGETGLEPFTIKNGYQLVAKNSGRCLEIAENSRANGAGVHQWDCGDPATRQDQVFTLRPVGAYYQLVARHSNRCIDVPGSVTYAGAGLQQYDCTGQPNQLWLGVPIETIGGNEYVHFVNKNSGLCLEVQNGGTTNGVVVVQNTCGSQASELWTFKSVESNQVPTNTFLTVLGTVNGSPGQVTVTGSVDFGGYAAGEQWVTVNFQKEVAPNTWETITGNTLHPVLNAEGRYTVTQGAGVGNWRTRAIFSGSGPLAESASEYHPFTISPGGCTTETFVTPSNPISSQPGFITINGHVNVPNPECGVVNERWLNVNFYKENGSGQFVYVSTDHPVVYNGAYSEVNRPVGSGNWKVQAVFPGQDWFKESSSGLPPFTIGANGWHIDNLGGTFTADPEISSQGPGKLNVFGRGAENGLWIDSYPVSGGWGGWISMGGALASGPGSVSWSSGRIDVVMVEPNQTISHWYWAGSGWAADNLGGTITADPDISSWGPNRLDVFARGIEGGLWHKYWSNGWSGWESMGGSLAGGPSAVSWGPNRIDVVARMTDNTIGHWYWAGAGWVYDNLGGNLTSDPAISSQGGGLLDVFARGTDMGLWHRWFAGGWSNWEPMGGYITSGPGAVSWSGNRVDVVARAANNSLEHWWFQG